MQSQHLVQMEKVSKHFPGVQALEQVDFEIYPGEILGLVGENGAGKSTLIKILSGVYSRDQGIIQFQGQVVDFRSPYAAQEHGIATIYQELALVPQLSVAENVFLNREPRRSPLTGAVDFRKMREQSEAIMADLGVHIPGDRLVKDLTIASQQMVEIAKAISRNASLLLMDEPTSALSSKEVEVLLNLMQRLKQKGVSVVFVSHRLEEVLRVVDRIIVMRDGQRVATLSAEEANEAKLIHAMVGREVGLFPKTDVLIGDPVLEVRDVSGQNGVRNVSLTVHKGEIVGIAGLIGAGRTELVRLICGADRRSSGEIFIDGKRAHISSPAHAVAHGIGWVPEDRKQHGLVLGMDIKQNTTMAILRRISNRFGTLRMKSERDIAAHYRDALSIATSDLSKTVKYLSGGNQQKVVLAKWLSTKPKILIMDEPTRGIDIGAKAEFHALMSQLAEQGIGILMISSEMPEIMGMSDRVIVMCQGRVTGEFKRGQMSQVDIMTSATKFLSLDAAPEPEATIQPEAS
jgi:ribose transport system ATP-binding protein